MNGWEALFSQSKANHGFYDEDCLPQTRWEWPQNTWFQARLDYVREHELIPFVKPQKKLKENSRMRYR